MATFSTTADDLDAATPAPQTKYGQAAVVLENIGHSILRYGLVIILLAFGPFKWTHTEAMGIQNWGVHSPFLSWAYHLFSVDGASRFIGGIEIVIAVLIASRRWFPMASFVGSLAAAGMFVTTLSFLATTPNSWATVEGFTVPTLDASFLVKDIFLLGAALWSAGEAWQAAQKQRRTANV